MAGDACDVCGTGKTVGVASLTGIPMSAAFCGSCLQQRAEPYWAHRANVACCLDSNVWDKWNDKEYINQAYLDGIRVWYEGTYMSLREALEKNPFTKEEFLKWEEELRSDMHEM